MVNGIGIVEGGCQLGLQEGLWVLERDDYNGQWDRDCRRVMTTGVTG